MLTAAQGRPPKTFILAERWRQYERTGDRAVRDQLILAYSPIVKYVAGRVAARMPAHVDIADLVSYGLGGLIEAVERFEPSRGVGFESYAMTRIRGAIIDELRSQDWVPRAVRSEARAITQATADLTTRLQRLPTDAELAAKLSMKPAELDASLQRVVNARTVALDEPAYAGQDGGLQPALVETLADTHADDPDARLDASDLRERIAAAIEHLPDRQQVILGLRYHQELTFSDIGEILGVSESRICQLHGKAVLQVGALLDAEAASGG
jgi:RNA polymerase sigma factor for flagellar operon FliA